MKKRTVITTEKHETWAINRDGAETLEKLTNEGLESLVSLSDLLESDELTPVTGDCLATPLDSHQVET